MPHAPRLTLLLAGWSLLLLASSPSLAQAPSRTKSPGPRTHTFAVDPARLSPAQRLKLASAETPLPATAPMPAPRPRGLSSLAAGPPASPEAISPAERAVLEARAKAKLERYQQGPSPRPGRKPTAAKGPAPWKPRGKPPAVTAPHALTPAERAKAEAAGIHVPASDGVQR
jgi:hypothetical protein